MAKIFRGLKTALAIAFWLAVAAVVLSYLMQDKPGNADGCAGDLVPEPRMGVECVTKAESIDTHATMVREAEEGERDNRYLGDEATRQAERGAEQMETERREREDAREEAVRSCILAGNNGDLCSLNPWDPYGLNDRD